VWLEGRRRETHTEFRLGGVKETGQLQDLGIDGSKILEEISGNKRRNNRFKEAFAIVDLSI
jgi:hypothetical protein